MNIELLDYNAIKIDGSAEFIGSLNSIEKIILAINEQSSHLITKEEKEWILGLKAWMINHDTRSDVSQIVWAYNSIRAKLKTIEGRFREDDIFQPYIDDLTRVWTQAFTNPTSLSEEDKKNLAQYFWASEYNALKNGNVKTISMPDTKFNFQELNLDARLLNLGEQNLEALTNMGVIFYCKELRNILWENKPINSSLRRSVKIFKNSGHDPIYSESFKSIDYQPSQIQLLVKSIPDYLQSSVDVDSVEKASGQKIEDLFFDFIYDYTGRSNPMDALEYRALFNNLTSIENSDESVRQSNLGRITSLYKNTAGTKCSFHLCLLLVDKTSRKLFYSDSTDAQKQEARIQWAKQFSEELGNNFTHQVRSCLLSCFNTKRGELLNLNFIEIEGSEWGAMRTRFALKHINHSIISQKAIEEKVKLEEAIGSIFNPQEPSLTSIKAKI